MEKSRKTAGSKSLPAEMHGNSTLLLVGAAPNVHFLRFSDQLLPELGMGNANQTLGSLPGGLDLHIEFTVI